MERSSLKKKKGTSWTLKQKKKKKKKTSTQVKGYFLFYFGATLLALCSEISPGRRRGPYGMGNQTRISYRQNRCRFVPLKEHSEASTKVCIKGRDKLKALLKTLLEPDFLTPIHEGADSSSQPALG